ncbi:hypothetical protein ATE47_01505 [Chryseobacterium sp. IHB B 17019]|uniref:hypothetical protein n=1 Tax=Chryseobacterium sp. IHB B 17019 TaxID=1721091 RepID=UPI00071F9D98|nr:hypothetical protein [Chryseobacterium sp. IHB B 17019]ALR29287.1 hypothetical protein ATE47_01505 [Chryseobacterium sp. IHB B 17019]
MADNSIKIKEMLDRYLNGKCTEAEIALIESSYLSYSADAVPLNEDQIREDLESIRSKLPK